ncbi:MAG: S9 family peptidase [Bacteroidota bacterium]
MRKLALSWAVALLVISSYAQQKIEIRNTVDGTFRAQSVRSLNWMNDGQFYSALVDNKIVKFSVKSGEAVEDILDGNALNLSIVSYSFSDDESLVLIMTEREAIYRRSYTAVFYLYDRNTQDIKQLADGRQSYATISPDNQKVAFTRDNNLFFVSIETGEETAVTTDGEFNAIINGSSDWVYEEELYLTQAFAWSPDSKKIAFYRFDETLVPEYNMQVWNEGALYPEDYRYKYPKAGETNATVEIHVYSLSDKKITKADIGQEKDIYIPRVYWTQDPELLSVQRLNRLQNKLDILHVNASTGTSKTILSDLSDTYIDITFTDDLTYLKNGKQFIYSTEKDGYKHFYLYNLDGSLVNQITKGAFEAVDLVGLDQKRKKLYYTSTEDSPLERHLYSVSLSGGKKQKLTSKSGMHYLNMSDDCTYYMDYHSSSTMPLEVSLYSTKGNKLVKVMKSNESLLSKTEDFGWSKKEYFKIDNGKGQMLNAYFLKPADFDETKKYPLLIYQYSGPGSQQVSNSWGGSHFAWHQYLAQNGYLVAVVDPRGTGYRGADFKKVTYRQLGKYETEDMITAAKVLADYEYVDEDRIGIWGWSYGGYMSSLCILKGNDVFKTAIAIAPVTTWRYYDTIYTERYLQRPQDNPSGYDDNSPNSYADRLEGNFLLVHGTGDDNVHFQNAVTLQDELIDAGKQFDSYYYPDRPHSLGNRRPHLYQMMANFLMEKL